MARHADQPAGKIWILIGLILTAFALSLIATAWGTSLVHGAFPLHVGR